MLDLRQLVTGLALLVATLAMTSAWPGIRGWFSRCYGWIVHCWYLLQPEKRELEKMYWYLKKNPHLRGQ